jgi:hypothetical protein
MVQQDYQNQIDYLKEQILEDYIDDDDAKISIIDLLSEYDQEGIDAIREIILDPSIKNQKIKDYGLELIRKSIKS